MLALKQKKSQPYKDLQGTNGTLGRRSPNPVAAAEGSGPYKRQKTGDNSEVKRGQDGKIIESPSEEKEVPVSVRNNYPVG